MTRAYLYPPRRYFEVIAAMFAGGYGLTVLHLLPAGNPLRWAGYSIEDAICTAGVMLAAAFTHALGIYINGRWRWSPVLRFMGMAGHSAMFLMLVHAANHQPANTAGYVYACISILMASGAYSALRDSVNALRGEVAHGVGY